MNRVLAFDQGNTTGWAFADDDGEITFGTWHFDTTQSEAARWVCAAPRGSGRASCAPQRSWSRGQGGGGLFKAS